MKPTKTKAQIRAEIEEQMRFFTQQGGSVAAHDMGDTGREPSSAIPTAPFTENSNQARTQVIDQVRAIESRRKRASSPPTNTPNKKPKRVLVTDDFGEPLRWIWKN